MKEFVISFRRTIEQEVSVYVRAIDKDHAEQKYRDDNGLYEESIDDLFIIQEGDLEIKEL